MVYILIDYFILLSQLENIHGIFLFWAVEKMGLPILSHLRSASLLNISQLTFGIIYGYEQIGLIFYLNLKSTGSISMYQLFHQITLQKFATG